MTYHSGGELVDRYEAKVEAIVRAQVPAAYCRHILEVLRRELMHRIDTTGNRSALNDDRTLWPMSSSTGPQEDILIQNALILADFYACTKKIIIIIILVPDRINREEEKGTTSDSAVFANLDEAASGLEGDLNFHQILWIACLRICLGKEHRNITLHEKSLAHGGFPSRSSPQSQSKPKLQENQ